MVTPPQFTPNLAEVFTHASVSLPAREAFDVKSGSRPAPPMYRA